MISLNSNLTISNSTARSSNQNHNTSSIKLQPQLSGDCVTFGNKAEKIICGQVVSKDMSELAHRIYRQMREVALKLKNESIPEFKIGENIIKQDDTGLNGIGCKVKTAKPLSDGTEITAHYDDARGLFIDTIGKDTHGKKKERSGLGITFLNDQIGLCEHTYSKDGNQLSSHFDIKDGLSISNKLLQEILTTVSEIKL